MAILLDSGILYAFYDRRDAWHIAAVNLIARERGMPPSGYVRVHELNRRYRNLRLGFVDAAVLATAEILGVSRIATTDRRDFEIVRASFPIEILPS